MQRAGEEMEWEQVIRQRQVGGVTLTVWGHARPPRPGMLLFFPNEYLYQAHDNTITQFLYKNVQAIQRVGDRDILIILKTFQVLRVTTTTRSDVLSIVETLTTLSTLPDVASLYAFYYHPDFARDNNPFADAEVWFLYDPVAQMARMKVPTADWRITDINADYKFCASYPNRFIVPSGLEDFFLEAVAQFRQRRRIPALSYYHAASRAAILRSGQPLVGLNRRRCYEDEKLFSAAVRQGPKEAPPVIIDARTKAAATGAQTRGGGFEPAERYSQAKILFARLEPGATLQTYLDRMLDGLRHRERLTSSAWLVDSSAWLSQVQFCLLKRAVPPTLGGLHDRAAATVAQSVSLKGSTVLLHCEEDADTVSILAALSKLCLDPYYRTHKGFQVLIEEDWLAFGYRFADRCGHLLGEPTTNRRDLVMPFFTLFIDGVLQMMDQYPTAFEFNLVYVHRIFEHTASCQFGTFLLNSERERNGAKLSERTVSLWTALDQPGEAAGLTNEFYRPVQGVLPISSDIRAVNVQFGLYAPWLVPSQLQSQLRHDGHDAALTDLKAEWERYGSL